MATNVYANTTTIDQFSNDLKNEASSMNSILEELITLTQDMEQFYDTPTAKTMKESLLSYLNDSIETCKTLDSIGNTVSKAKDIYETTISNMSSSVRG